MRSKKASDKTEQLRLQLHHPQSSVFVSLSSLPFLVSKTNLVFLGIKILINKSLYHHFSIFPGIFQKTILHGQLSEGKVLPKQEKV